MKLIFILFFAFPFVAFSQETSIEGKVFDNINEPLEATNIYLVKNKKGVYTNSKGYFVLADVTLPDTAIVSFIGYGTQKIIISSNEFLKINLISSGNVLEDAVVTDIYNSVDDVQAGEITLNSKDIEKLPIIFGEQDIVKMLQFLPGVQQGKEGQSGMFVRGGNNSMNLFLIDDIYLHNTSHIGGFLSAINTDIIESLTFSKSGIPAEFGGKLSSVTSIQTNPSSEEFTAKGSIGVISSKISIKQPIEAIKTDIQITGRRTYFDLVKPLFSNDDNNSLLNKNLSYFFYDYSIKTKTKINSKNELSFLLFNTYDSYVDNSENSYKDMSWRNTLIGLEWKHYFLDNFISKTIVSNSKYDFKFKGLAYPYKYSIDSDIDIYSIKNINYIFSENNRIKFGFEYNFNQNIPKYVNAKLSDVQLEVENPGKLYSHDFSFFVSDEFALNDNLLFNAGLRISNFINTNLDNDIYDASYKYYYGIEPRLSVRYTLDKKTSIKFSYNRIFQFYHQATMASLSLPIDFYMPSTVDIAPQEVNQVSIGYYKNIRGFNISAETYYKLISNMSEFKNGSINNLFNPDLYDDMVFGKTYSYGLELSVSKNIDKMMFMTSYTLSRSISEFEDINEGNPFPSAFDRPHNFNTLVSYDISDKWEVSGVFVFTSGQNFTAPSDIRIINESVIVNYSDKNSMRFPNYHRLDVSVTYKFKERKGFKSKLNFTIYNVYNNNNPFYIDYVVSGSIEDNSITIKPETTTLFPVMPTITWMFEL